MPELSSEAPTRSRRAHALWLLGALAVGFGVSFVFSDRLHWSRREFLMAHVILSGGFVSAYFRWACLNVRGLFRAGRKLPGVANVLSQPSSPRPEGLALYFAVTWEGLVYGLVDALLPSVVPVAIAREAFSPPLPGWKPLPAVAGIAASVAIRPPPHY